MHPADDNAGAMEHLARARAGHLERPLSKKVKGQRRTCVWLFIWGRRRAYGVRNASATMLQGRNGTLGRVKHSVTNSADHLQLYTCEPPSPKRST